jgi:hypothetical protein
MSFVQGHARAAGWVVAHVRRPNRPEAGQLSLLPEPVLTEGAVPGVAPPRGPVISTRSWLGHAEVLLPSRLIGQGRAPRTSPKSGARFIPPRRPW